MPGGTARRRCGVGSTREAPRIFRIGTAGSGATARGHSFTPATRRSWMPFIKEMPFSAAWKESGGCGSTAKKRRARRRVRLATGLTTATRLPRPPRLRGRKAERMQFRPSPSEPPFNTDVAQRPSTGRPPALLLGGGLNLIRPLGFAGIPVIVASPNPHEPAIWSRYCHGHYLLPPLHEPEAMLSALIAIGDQIVSDFGCRAPLYYGDDDYLNLIYSYRHELSQRFLMVLNEPEVASALIDKQRFEAFARNRGLMLPRTLAWDGPGPDSLADAAGPVLVKPKVKLGWDDSFIQLRIFGCGAKARIFPSAREVM